MFVLELKKIVNNIENKDLLFGMKTTIPKSRVLNIFEGNIIDKKVIFNASTQPGRRAMKLYALVDILNKANDIDSIYVRDVDLQDMYSIDNYHITEKYLEIEG